MKRLVEFEVSVGHSTDKYPERIPVYIDPDSVAAITPYDRIPDRYTVIVAGAREFRVHCEFGAAVSRLFGNGYQVLRLFREVAAETAASEKTAAKSAAK